MEDKLVFVIDDTNEYTLEDLDAFEAALDPEVVSRNQAKVRAIFDSYYEKRHSS